MHIENEQPNRITTCTVPGTWYVRVRIADRSLGSSGHVLLYNSAQIGQRWLRLWG